MIGTARTNLNGVRESEEDPRPPQPRMVSAFTLVNKVSENHSLIKCRSDQVKKTKCADS